MYIIDILYTYMIYDDICIVYIYKITHRTNAHRLYDSYSLNVFGSILEALGLFDASLIATVQPDVVMVNAALRGYGAKLGSLGGDRPYYGLNGDTLRIWSGKHELEEVMGFLNGQFSGFHHQN